MSLNIPSNKAEVMIRHEHGRTYPGLNVKRYNSPAWTPDKIREHFGCTAERAEKVATICYDVAVEDFWHICADAALATAFGEDHGLEVYSAGRMGGTLIVKGLPDVESWNGVALGRWRKFARLIKSEIEYLESWEWGREMIDANDWAPREGTPAAERQTIDDSKDAQRRALKAFFSIHAELDGHAWDADTLGRIAEHVRGAGLTIREPEGA